MIALLPCQKQTQARKFNESILAKCNKIRALIIDLKTNYPKDSEKLLSFMRELFVPSVCTIVLSLLRSVKTLGTHLANMEAEYQKVAEHLAKGQGDEDGFNARRIT